MHIKTHPGNMYTHQTVTQVQLDIIGENFLLSDPVDIQAA